MFSVTSRICYQRQSLILMIPPYVIALSRRHGHEDEADRPSRSGFTGRISDSCSTRMDPTWWDYSVLPKLPKVESPTSHPPTPYGTTSKNITPMPLNSYQPQYGTLTEKANSQKAKHHITEQHHSCLKMIQLAIRESTPDSIQKTSILLLDSWKALTLSFRH